MLPSGAVSEVRFENSGVRSGDAYGPAVRQKAVFRMDETARAESPNAEIQQVRRHTGVGCGSGSDACSTLYAAGSSGVSGCLPCAIGL